MNKQQIKKKILDFIDNGDYYFTFFWLDNFPGEHDLRDVNFPNSDVSSMDEGIYDKVGEIDFRKFSFNNLLTVMKKRDVNGELKEIVNALKEIIDENKPENTPKEKSWRIKKTRIYFYELLKNPNFKFYYPELYKECQVMADNKVHKAKEIAESYNCEVISYMKDSVSYIAGESKVKMVRRKIEEELDHELTLRWLTRVVCFRSVNRYKLKNGETYIKRNTYTGPEEELKEKLTKDLIELDYHKAKRRIADFSFKKDKTKLKKSYIKSVNEIQDKREGNCHSIKEFTQ